MKTVKVAMDDALHEKLMARCQVVDRTTSQTMRQALRYYLSHTKPLSMNLEEDRP